MLDYNTLNALVEKYLGKGGFQNNLYLHIITFIGSLSNDNFATISIKYVTTTKTPFTAQTLFNEIKNRYNTVDVISFRDDDAGIDGHGGVIEECFTVPDRFGISIDGFNEDTHLNVKTFNSQFMVSGANVDSYYIYEYGTDKILYNV